MLGLLRWLAWIALILLAGLQVYVLMVRELAVPDFVLRSVENRMAEAGLHARFGEITLDPTGKLLLQDARLSLLSSDTVVMRAKSISLHIDPVALWLKSVEPSEIRFDGLDLLIPPTRSPSGDAEPWLQGINTALRLGEKERLVLLDHFTANLGAIAISAHGQFALPLAQENEQRLPIDRMVALFAENYLRYCDRVSELLPQLPELRDAKVELVLAPHLTRGATVQPRVSASFLELDDERLPTGPIRLEEIALAIELDENFAPEGPVILDAASLQLPGKLVIEGVHAEVSLERDTSTGHTQVEQLKLIGHTTDVKGTTLSAITAQASLAGAPIVQANATVLAGGSAWALSADLDATNGAGRAKVAGKVDMALLHLISDRIDFDIPSILSWEDQPALTASAILGPGGKPISMEADFSTTAVNARYVPLAATSAHVTWQNNRLRADQILLRTHQSEAFGSYEMHTESRAFRFLLEGRLIPADINGWFRDWWPRFFRTFDFQGGPPEASVEVSGIWGAPLETRVFVSAEADQAAVKDIPLDRMRTRLFVRPGWVDVTHFLAERTMGDIEGAFTRTWRLPDGRRWTELTIDARGRSDLLPLPKLMPTSGEAIIEPFEFSQPLDLVLRGSVRRDDLGAPTTEDFRVQGATTGSWKFKGFPLEGLSFDLHRTTDVVLVENFQTRLGGGAMEGRAELRGPTGGEKALAFDINLEDAEMGRTLNDVLTWTASRRGESKAGTSDFEKLMQAGKLTVSLTAQGPSDDAMALNGAGSAAVTHPNLANINLLGPLSTLLQRTILNFSTLQLNQANADFTLNGPDLVFPSVKITGERGAMQATGRYSFATKELDFNNRVRPFEGGEGLLDAVFTPFSSALEVKLRGKLNDPKWTFVYGPTNILRNLTGENNRTSSPTPDDDSINPAPTSPSLDPEDAVPSE
ncbi:MAG: hypothetical protein SynsKO_29900 [Synoicihabitans sp.]